MSNGCINATTQWMHHFQPHTSLDRDSNLSANRYEVSHLFLCRQLCYKDRLLRLGMERYGMVGCWVGVQS